MEFDFENISADAVEDREATGTLAEAQKSITGDPLFDPSNLLPSTGPHYQPMVYFQYFISTGL
jgi:hypothetical protein